MKILITGANGQMGQSFQNVKDEFPNLVCTFTDREHLDITHYAEIEQVLNRSFYDYLINCAAYTAVDRAENNKEHAHMVNADAAAYLAKACQKKKVRLIHFSTDYVYHNSINRPLRENDPTKPESVYGKTKLDGEKNIVLHNDDHIILRTSWVYGEYGHNFMKSMKRLMKERDALKIVEDQIGSPTYSKDLAKAVLEMIHKDNWNPGIYNFSNHGVCSWFDFAFAIRELGQYNCQLAAIPSTDYPTPATRPPYSVLDTSKFEKTFDYTIRPWQEALMEAFELSQAKATN